MSELILKPCYISASKAFVIPKRLMDIDVDKNYRLIIEEVKQ